MRKILLIDDDTETANGIKKVLSKYYNVIYAETAFEAIKIIRSDMDIVAAIVDIHLNRGDGDGITCASNLKVKNPKLNIFVYSALTIGDDAQSRVVELGGTFVTKPIHGEKLFQIISSAIENSHVQ